MGYSVVHTFTTPTSGTTIDITSSKLGSTEQPIAAEFYASIATTDDTEAAHSSISIGVTDGTTQGALFSLDRDGLISTDTARGQATNRVIQVRGGDASFTEIAGFSFNSWINQGVRLNCNTTTTGVICVVVFHVGYDEAEVGAIDLGAASGDVSVTSMTGQPNLVKCFTNGRPIEASSSQNQIGIGIASDNGVTVDQGCIVYSSADGYGTSRVASIASSSNVYVDISPVSGGTAYTVTFTSFDANGFTVTLSASSGNDDMLYLALDTGSQSTYAGLATLPTSTGDWTVTAPGFQPVIGGVVASLCQLDGTIEQDADAEMLAIGSWDATDGSTINVMSQDGSGTSYATSLADNVHLHGETNNAGAYTDRYLTNETGDPFNANGWALSFATVTTGTRYGLIWAIETASAGTNITPGQGNLTLSFTAPTIAQTTNADIAPSVGNLVLSTTAPTKVVNHNLNPTQGNITFTTSAPSVATTGTSPNITPAQGDISLSATAPTISQTTIADITPAQANLALSTNAPTIAVTENRNISPGQANLSLSTVAATLTQTTNAIIVPSQGSITLSTSASTINVSGVIWTVQTPDATSWSDQTPDSTIWSVQTEDSTTWTEQ